MAGFLVESALFTHGLVSLSNKTLLDSWPEELDNIVWVDAGKVIVGSMEEYLSFRDRAAQLCRISCDTLELSLASGISGALTASGTMAVCQRMGLSLAVTCGMGGIGDIRGEALCPDLPALRDIPVALLSTSPKDMLDIPATICWLDGRGRAGAGGRYIPVYRLYLRERRRPPLRYMGRKTASGGSAACFCCSPFRRSCGSQTVPSSFKESLRESRPRRQDWSTTPQQMQPLTGSQTACPPGYSSIP